MSVKIGDTASRTKTLTDADVRAFADATGDDKSVHLDEAAAAQTIFGQRVVQGALTAGVVSAVLGNDLPGPGTILLSQASSFKKPVFIDDTVTATLEVVAYREDKRITTLRATCTNQHGDIVLEGEAVVIAPEP